MSTYWYMDVDVRLRVSEDEAAAIFAEALSTHSTCFYGERRTEWNVDHIASKYPFHAVEQRTDIPWTEFMESGWLIRDGRLHARLFVENLTQTHDENDGSGDERIFEAIQKIAAAEPGDIVGALASENADCRGPIIALGKCVRWKPSRAAHPASYSDYDEDPDHAPITRLPADVISDDGSGFTCDVDLDALVERIS